MRQDPQSDLSGRQSPASTSRPKVRDPAAILLGYCNFSSGGFDAAAWRAMNDLFEAVEPFAADGRVEERADAAAIVAESLAARLATLEASEPAFRDAAQVRAVLDVVFARLPAAYRAFHGDLLEHQPPGGLERPFWLMAALQAAAAADPVGRDPDEVVAEVIKSLNDYVGWRPVAVLENGRLSEPYPHERVRPVPLYVRGAGAAHGRHRRLVEGAIAILEQAPEPLLRQADFELDRLEELALDPRAFDFLHPAASRPNYLFGLWDPARIDEAGHYRRMVVQQATLDGILSWPDAAATGGGPADERRAALERESAAVLAGVMLMASGLSGHGPGAASASLPLAELLPRIASYRDEFYRWLMTRLPAEHRRALEEEARLLRQPFGGVRRHINSLLAGRRARQVECVTLAATLARLGRADGAERLAGMVPAASARMAARITSLVVAAERAVRGMPAAAGEGPVDPLERLDQATALLMRAIDCGALVDPWNILGLGGQFPLHEPGGESVSDPRVDELVALVESILDGYAAVWRQAGLDGPPATAARAAAALDRVGGWWDRFATTAVSGVPHLSGREARDSAREVIAALERRREVAPQAALPGFWRDEVAAFTTPQTHAQATDCLLREGDLDGAMGLIVHWASLLEGTEIDRSGSIWLREASRWLTRACADHSATGRSRVRRFLELIEANTSGVLDVIEAAAAGRGPGDGRRSVGDEGDDEADGGGEESVASAYESMVWRDSTDDGVDGGMLDIDGGGDATIAGVNAIEDAAELLAGVCRMVADAAVASAVAEAAAGIRPDRAEREAAAGWRRTLRRYRAVLIRAAESIAARGTPPPGLTAADADKLRWHRDAAAERLVEAALEASEAGWLVAARLRGRREVGGKATIGAVFAVILAGDVAAAREQLAILRDRLAGRMVLYVPMSRGGKPERVVLARSRERLLERLAACLPRLGLVAETAEVVHLAKALEGRRPPGGASVSEFDRVFAAATKALVERIVESAAEAGADGRRPTDDEQTQRILDGLALLVPRLLDTWTAHARQLRLSVLERVRDDKSFAAIREFVERYGAGLFTQQFLSPPSLRGVLRGGVRPYLEQLVERAAGEPDDGDFPGAARPQRPARLIADLASGALPWKQAVPRLRLVLESVAENHAEYRDWNSTTTQSDRGECLHVLLEFLRVKAEHERIAWTLRPVNMAHRVLARRGAVEAAAAWRARMRDETAGTANELAERLARVEAETGVRLASVSDRVRRPFAAALEQDELEALVEPAVAELFTGTPEDAGRRLEERAEAFLGVAGGSGVELPAWLDRLSTAVDRAIERAEDGLPSTRSTGRLPDALPWARLEWAAVEQALAK